MSSAIGNNLFNLDQNYPWLIGEQFLDCTIAMDQCPAIYPQSGTIRKINKQHPYVGIFKDITHTHECPVAIKVRESKSGTVDDLNNAGTTPLERAVARSIVIASG
jgi:hypothetical protein